MQPSFFTAPRVNANRGNTDVGLLHAFKSNVDTELLCLFVSERPSVDVALDNDVVSVYLRADQCLDLAEFLVDAADQLQKTCEMCGQPYPY